ncbi:MAG TPA: glycosyltransferase family 4 protein [Solirubrobacterales bacterium]|jgi:glycosyltransferase involved in cell wall biosynthesis
MRVQIVDPAAQTPPFDRSLAAALARAGADVELQTSHFVHGPVPDPEGYAVSEFFYPRSSRLPSGSLQRRALGLAEHVPGMLRHRRAARNADVVHYQWVPLPQIDARLLPRGRPLVLTTHGFLRPGAGSPAGFRRVLERMDAVIALAEYGARRLREEAGVPEERIHVIPHGALDYLTRLPERPLPAELGDPGERPVILSFGLIRPYKGVDLLLRAFAQLEADAAELWVVGRPLGVDLAELERHAAAAPGRVRLLTRFVPDADVPAIFRRADVVALPYREVDQSGVLYTALAFGKAIVASAVGGFPEVARAGAGGTLRLVPPGDEAALAEALAELVADRAARERLEVAAAAAAAGPYSWDAIAAQTLDLYERLLRR